MHVQRELAVLDQPMSTVGDVAMGLEVTFLNSAVDSVGKPTPPRTPSNAFLRPCSNSYMPQKTPVACWLHGACYFMMDRSPSEPALSA